MTGDQDDAYYVCFTINKGQSDEVRTCACAKSFIVNEKEHQFEADTAGTGLVITATYTLQTGGKVFVNADYKGEKNIECYAQWINASGNVYQNLKFDIPDGGCTIDVPAESGLYLLYVKTGKGSRSFKFVIQ